MPIRPPIESRQGDVILRVRVRPIASRNAIVVAPSGSIRVTLTARPVEGKANVALVKFVSGLLGVAKGAVRVSSGAKSREKTLVIQGTVEESVRDKLLEFSESERKA